MKIGQNGLSVRRLQKGGFMRYQILLLFLVAFGVHEFGVAIYTQDSDKKEKDAAFSFADVKYFHRFTKDDQYEYTPSGQEDLKAWADMVTIHYYHNAKDGETLID
jgi:hypothetical protein